MFTFYIQKSLLYIYWGEMFKHGVSKMPNISEIKISNILLSHKNCMFDFKTLN